MNEYIIKRVHTAPDWSQIPSLEVSNIAWLPDAGIRMTQQICYDESAIYVHQRAAEAHIRAEHSDPLAMVCEDSCMEFFFSPYEENLRYINVEINPNGCLYMGLCERRGNSVRLIAGDPQKRFDIHTARTEDCWEVFYKLPLSFIQLFNPAFTLNSGRVIPANCYKCGDLTVQEHYITWNPMSTETPDYHRPEDFGRMILE